MRHFNDAIATGRYSWSFENEEKEFSIIRDSGTAQAALGSVAMAIKSKASSLFTGKWAQM